MASCGDGIGASSAGTHSGNGVWIFVDDSNLWIEAKKLAARLRDTKTKEDPRVRVDIGILGDVVAAGRPNKGNLYGSVPPPIDTVWDKIRSQGWDVRTHQRSKITGKEKKVDNQIAVDITELVCDQNNLQYGNTVIIITGDADVLPAVECALKKPLWKVEVKMWRSGLSSDIIKESEMHIGRMTASALDSDFDKIAFINYCYNVNKSADKAVVELQNAVVLVNPQKPVDEQWKQKMDGECRYPFQYFEHSASDTNDQFVVVVFSMLAENGLADMIVKIKRSSDLNLNADRVLTYSGHMVNSTDNLLEQGKSERYKTDPCNKYARGIMCPYGDRCNFAHGEADAICTMCHERGHFAEGCLGSNVKTVLCNNYAQDIVCSYGDRCTFAHGEADAFCLKCRKRGHFTEGCPEP